MKTNIKLPILPYSVIKVKEGDIITPLSTIAEIPIKTDLIEIDIATLLHVKPHHLMKYLVKKIGESVAEGEILAQKQGLFSSVMVKSPVKGKINSIDLKKGTVVFNSDKNLGKGKLSIPVEGKVIKIIKNYLEIEITGNLIKAHKGQGSDVVGNLVSFHSHSVQLFDFDDRVAGAIILIHELNEEAAIKLEVLGLAGIITQKEQSFIKFPYCIIDEDAISKLIKMSVKKIWLRPVEKEIIILE
ncbi:hypothetical protein A2Y99_02770 [Candidatus Gottesmanbacteria bacterium RBG_13_37_7]|uniref:RnfC Barrel sandwich hybrid domain-containing protein n=1 Tax=Candidatus Gottesmanbacteria bacterium RBG_13_37_7 TaxID=1798369 RepID=A0A1F5YJV4_9BACT|nr:MAG: hypothetical protein A2Y99_02770 [Candidatus Gottesmanbacteria bacterium RBG_13_37_7]